MNTGNMFGFGFEMEEKVMAPKMQSFLTRTFSLFIALFVISALLAGCALPISIASVPSPTSPSQDLSTPTPIPATPTPLSVQDTPTPTSTPDAGATLSAIASATAAQVMLDTPTLEPATSTPIIASGNTVSSSGDIVFTAGTTAGVVQGTVAPGQVLSYTLGVGLSQPMVLIMDSPGSDVTIGLLGPNGAVLVDPANRWWNWQGMLPMSGMYTIQVIGGATTENFTLTIKIAQVVNFASGTSSITLSGTTINGYLFDYALFCNGGQTLTASLNVPSTTAYLDIYGLQNGTLLSDSTRASTWSGILPQSQYYIVEVVPNNSQVVDYVLTLSCTGVAVNANPTVDYSSYQGGDLLIAPGSTAVVRNGSINPGQVVTYTIQGTQYQPMIINVDSPNFDVTIGLRAPDGTYMFDPAKDYLNYQTPIHITGLYTIEVIGGSHTENYSLTVKLPKHVYLGNGTNSVSIKSATEQGYIVSYAINGNAGAVLTASLNVSSDVAYLDIFGVETGSVLSYSAKASSWTGTLKTTQYYVIEVIPRGGQIVGYTLTLTLH
jgi:hypothetical protein